MIGTFILDILATLWTCPNTGAVIAVSGVAKEKLRAPASHLIIQTRHLARQFSE